MERSGTTSVFIPNMSSNSSAMAIKFRPIGNFHRNINIAVYCGLTSCIRTKYTQPGNSIFPLQFRLVLPEFFQYGLQSVHAGKVTTKFKFIEALT